MDYKIFEIFEKLKKKLPRKIIGNILGTLHTRFKNISMEILWVFLMNFETNFKELRRQYAVVKENILRKCE